jgi:hypothetical protein
MNINIEKYKNSNFKLSNKHLIVKDRLIHIKNQLINQVGGLNVKSELELYPESRDDINNLINKIDYLTKDTKLIIDKIRTEAKKNKIENINDLLRIDSEMNKQFFEFYNLFKDEKNLIMLEKKDEVKTQLIEIHKGLFKLQVNTIFSKLKEIELTDPEPIIKEVIKEVIKTVEVPKEVIKTVEVPSKEKPINIQPLLSVINNKIKVMNEHIENTEKEKTEIRKMN